ncbi:hypothetical protein CC86DRAFT_167314 [Ophiobolus disseminans]|uniref:Uncharacterized protein n=1 Tax=Ophiobolus disseminans TaxID=1469910 RepID=A0A6A7ACB3_9PLEO|nr:hypothetical protein CC86DRAFT_167314 [Ophiobolus disseminans]
MRAQLTATCLRDARARCGNKIRQAGEDLGPPAGFRRPIVEGSRCVRLPLPACWLHNTTAFLTAVTTPLLRRTRRAGCRLRYCTLQTPQVTPFAGHIPKIEVVFSWRNIDKHILLLGCLCNTGFASIIRPPGPSHFRTPLRGPTVVSSPFDPSLSLPVHPCYTHATLPENWTTDRCALENSGQKTWDIPCDCCHLKQYLDRRFQCEEQGFSDIGTFQTSLASLGNIDLERR